MKVLVVVDMQHDFVDGALGTFEAKQIVENVKKKVELYWSVGDKVIYTQDTHATNYLQTQEGRNLPVEHCLKNSWGWEILSEVYKAGAPVVEKKGFGSVELSDMIAGIGEVESIELVGLCTDICVISNAMILKSRFPEIPISVDASCCAGVTPESHANALRAMQMCQIQVMS